MPSAIQRNFITDPHARVIFMREAASQTFKNGDLIGLNANRAEICVAAGSELTTASSVKILGKATRDAANLAAASTVEDLPIELITAHSVVTLPVYATLAADAQQQDIFPGQAANIRNQSGIICANLGSTSNPSLICIGRNKDYAATDEYVMVDFRVTPGALAFGS